MTKTIEFANTQSTHFLEITRFTNENDLGNIPIERCRNNFHTILYITQGNSLLEIDFAEYHIAPNQIVIIPQGTVYFQKQIQQPNGYRINFRDDFFSEKQQWLANGFLQYALVTRKLFIDIAPKKVPNLLKYFELLHEEQFQLANQNHTFLQQNLMLALLNKLEGLIQHVSGKNSFISKREVFQQFIVLVEASFKLQYPLDFYTTRLQITSRKLNEIIKEITGFTVTNFIINRIISEAKRELCFKGVPVKEIAYALGYKNQYYFSRLFKKHVKVSPEEFRKQFAQ